MHHAVSKMAEQCRMHNFSVNSHLVQSRLRIDVMPIIAYAGNTHFLARATVAQWF